MAGSILTAEGWVVASSFVPARAALVRTFAGLYEPDLLRRLQQVEKQDIVREYGRDPWLCNYFVNLWEYLKGEDTLTSYPYNITIPIADVCNARCSFCTSWLEGTKVLAVEDVDRFAEVLTHARVLGIAGHGEPLAHPRCEELLAKIGAHLDSRCQAYLITNGVFLWKQRLALAKVNVTTYNISLNATTPTTHDTVMGLGPDAFDSVMSALRGLIQQRNTENPRLEINISMVVNRDNVHELADFVHMGNDLGVNKIYLRTLNPQSSFPIGLNYHRLPPYLHPKFAEYVEATKVAIARSRSLIVTDAESWGTPVFSEPVEPLITIRPPSAVDRKEALKDKAVREFYGNYYERREKRGGLGQSVELEPGAVFDPMEDGSNPYNRSPHLHCTFVYQDFIINDFNLRLIPCCYMTDVPGFDLVRYDGSRPFFEYWNSPAFRTLRRTLREGSLYGACKKCPAQSVPPRPDAPRLDELEELRSKGSFRRLYDMDGAQLHRSLGKTFYGPAGVQEAVALAGAGLLFRPTDIRDHLATPNVDVYQGGKWLRFRCVWSPGTTALETCVFVMQDESFNMLPVIASYRVGEGKPEIESYVALPDDVRSVRLVMMALDMNPVPIPCRLQIEEIDTGQMPDASPREL